MVAILRPLRTEIVLFGYAMNNFVHVISNAQLEATTDRHRAVIHVTTHE